MINDDKLYQKFRVLYPEVKEENIFSCYSPYRVCPLGAHIDHQRGIVTGFALNLGINMVYKKNSDSTMELLSLNFDEKKIFDSIEIESKQGDWCDYLRAATWSLTVKKGIVLKKGISGVIYGEVPIGGLSSSSAVILCILQALCKVNDVLLSNDEMIEITQYAENKYVGVNSGTLDQSCIVLCEKDKLLVLDTLDGSYSNISKPEKMEDYEIAVFYSGVSRTLGKGYNTRVDEVKSASYCLKAFADLPYETYDKSVMRDVEKKVFEEYKDKLPKTFAKRAQHYYQEMDNVKKGIEAWNKGNLIEFGKLMTESGYSSIHNWETGSKELIALYEELKKIPGVYGGRFSGAGFKGCCMALINPKYKDQIKDSITKSYLKLFPEYKNSFKVFFCGTSSGVGSLTK